MVTVRNSVIVSILVITQICFGASTAGAQTVTLPIKEYPIPTPRSDPSGMALGADGNMWFTEEDAIGRITPTGVITEYPLPDPDLNSPKVIALGSDGNMWFTETSWMIGGCRIGRITPTGEITEYPTTTPGSNPFGIALGVDGNMWYTDWGRIGCITPTGVITVYPLPDSLWNGVGVIALGADGNMWFTAMLINLSGYAVGRISPKGVFTVYPLPNDFSFEIGLALGADGNMWFTLMNANLGGKIGCITPTGVITEYPCATVQPSGIALGADGNMWFTWGGIGSITPTGVITLYQINGTHGVEWIASDKAGNMWFTDYPNMIGVFSSLVSNWKIIT